MSLRNPPSKLTGAQSFYVPPNSEAVAILIYWLNNKTPKEIHAQFANLLQGQKVLKDIENLGHVLNNLGIITNAEIATVHDQDDRHCARCHATYLEKDNGIQACIIQHDFEHTRGTGTNAEALHCMTHYACCNKLLDIVVTGVYTPHFVGRHTTRADNVEFNDINVRTCEQLKCDEIDDSHVVAIYHQETQLGNQMGP